MIGLQNGEGDCGRVPDGRSGAQVLRGPLFVLSAAPLHHLHHARWGQFFFLFWFSPPFNSNSSLCRDSRRVWHRLAKPADRLSDRFYFIFLCRNSPTLSPLPAHPSFFRWIVRSYNKSRSPASCLRWIFSTPARLAMWWVVNLELHHHPVWTRLSGLCINRPDGTCVCARLPSKTTQFFISKFKNKKIKEK